MWLQMDVPLAHFEQQLRDTLAGLEIEPGLRYEVRQTDEELILKLLVSDRTTKQRLWELWRGDWPRWSVISFNVPVMMGTEIEWDGTNFLRRVAREFPWPISEWPISK
jgi:hypothetical protein